MKKFSLLLGYLKKFAGLAGAQLLVLLLLIGAIFSANGERGLYGEWAILSQTAFITSTPESLQAMTATTAATEIPLPTRTNTRQPTRTITATKEESPTATQTRTQTMTLTETNAASTKEITSTENVCGPPEGWVQYTVQSGDNLYRISLKFNITVDELKQANCLGSSTVIVVGEKIYVPNTPTSTPEQSQTPGENESSTQ